MIGRMITMNAVYFKMLGKDKKEKNGSRTGLRRQQRLRVRQNICLKM